MPELNYETIERPYDAFLQRSENDLSVGDPYSNQSQNIEKATSTPAVTGGQVSAATGNGNAQEQAVKDDGGMGDVWIRNFIRSENWKPKSVGFYINGLTGYAEFTNVYVSGNINALTGTIGGFDIGADYIRDAANSFGLSSTVSGGDDVRFWAGATFANRATAPFRVTEAGVMTATSAAIGGWIVDSTSIKDAAGLVGLSSAVTGGDDIRFWAGHATPASAPFYVTETGVIKASSGTVGGNVLSTTSIGSTTFVSGPLGSGWNISNTGSAEFQNVTIRGTIRTSVFEKDTISAVNGIVLVSKADVLTSDMTALDSSTLTISGESSFVANEVLRIKDGTDDEWMLVTSAASAPTYTVTRDLAGSYSANNNPIWKKGTAVVSMGVGSGTKTGFVLLDSSSSNSPYIDVYGRNSTTYSDYTIHGRYGWLKGITDADVGLSSTDVWGIYTDNAYIKGVIVANTGYIGGTTGWVISSGYLKDAAGLVGLSSVVTGGDDIRFWAGHATPASAPFRVYESGAIVATSATITGSVTATSGTIGGFDIGTDYIRDVANSFGLASTVTGSPDVRFWAGATFANRATAPFVLDEAGNVSVNSLRRKDFHWFTPFESIDGYGQAVSGAGSITVNGSTGVYSITGAVSGNYNELQKIVYNSGTQAFSWSKSRSGKFSILIQTDVNNHDCKIAVGPIQTLTTRHIGFHIVNGAVSGTVANGTTESTVSLTSISNNNIYVLEYYYSVDAASVYFYVNGTLYGTITTNIPSGTTHADWLLDWIWQTNAAVSKEMYLSFLDLWQSN